MSKVVHEIEINSNVLFSAFDIIDALLLHKKNKLYGIKFNVKSTTPCAKSLRK